MTLDRLAFEPLTPEQEDRATREILNMLRPGGLILVVHKYVYDAVKAKYPDMDIPGLICQQELPRFVSHERWVTPEEAKAVFPTRPLPYPPRKKGRYDR